MSKKPKLTDREKEVYKLISSQEHLGVKNIADAREVSYLSAYVIVESLLKKGMIVEERIPYEDRSRVVYKPIKK